MSAFVTFGLGGTSAEFVLLGLSGSAVLPDAPVAEFSGTPLSGNEPLSVDFTDESTNSPTSWAWYVNDELVSTEQNPTIVFEPAGTYTVKLVATNAGGSDEEEKVDYVTAAEVAPVAEFSATPRVGAAPKTVQFTDLSTHYPTSWSWEIDDGGGASEFSTEQHPSLLIEDPGTYAITLTATNGTGSDGETKADYIILVEAGPGSGESMNRPRLSVTIRIY